MKKDVFPLLSMLVDLLLFSCFVVTAGLGHKLQTLSEWHRPQEAAKDSKSLKAVAWLLLARSPAAAFDTISAFGGLPKRYAHQQAEPDADTQSQEQAEPDADTQSQSRDDLLTIVVAGATGKVGSMLMRQLLQSSQAPPAIRVVALVRNATKAHAFFGDDVETIEADYTDLDALKKALGSAALSQWRMFLACGNGPRQGQAEINLLAVAGERACEYVVKLSTVRTVLESKSGGPYQAHLEAEEALLGSTRIKYKTVLRPNLFMQMLQSGPLGLGHLIKSSNFCEHPFANTPISMIDCSDVAAVAGKLLTAEDPSLFDGQRLDLTGPAAVSVGGIAEVVSSLRPHNVSCKACSVKELVAGMRLPPFVAKELQSFFKVLSKSNFISDNVHMILGRPARSAAEFIYQSPHHFLPTTFLRLVGKGKDLSFRAGANVVRSNLAEALSEMKNGQVFLKVIVAGINGGADTFRIVNASEEEVDFPLGAEGVGRVVAASDGVDFAVGDIVSFVGGFAYAEYTSVDAQRCLRIAATAPLAEYVALRVSALTAGIALHHTAGIQESDVVLVTAACDATGSFAVQLAKLAGATVIGTVASEENVEVAKGLGCDRVVNYRQEDLGVVLRKEFPDGIHIAYEGVGGYLFRAAYDNLAEGGRILVVGVSSAYPHNQNPARHSIDGLDSVMDIFTSQKTVNLPGSRQIIGDVWGDLMTFGNSKVIHERDRIHELHAAGKLRALIIPDRFKGIEAIPDAVDYMLRNSNVGKVWVQCGV